MVIKLINVVNSAVEADILINIETRHMKFGKSRRRVLLIKFEMTDSAIKIKDEAIQIAIEDYGGVGKVNGLEGKGLQPNEKPGSILTAPGFLGPCAYLLVYKTILSSPRGEKYVVPEQPRPLNIFIDEPKEKRVLKSGGYFEIYEYGNVSEALIDGVIKKIKPFVGLHILKGGWTEIGVGCISEDNKSTSFWSLHDWGDGKNVSYYPGFKKAMEILNQVKEIKSNTCAHCYYVATGEMTFEDGEFQKIPRTSSSQSDQQLSPTKTRKNKLIRWIFGGFILTAIFLWWYLKK